MTGGPIKRYYHRMLYDPPHDKFTGPELVLGLVAMTCLAVAVLALVSMALS